MFGLLIKHIGKSICCYRLTALYLVAGVALATAHAPVRYNKPPTAPSVQQEGEYHAPSKNPIPSRFRLDLGQPPYIFHVVRITIAAWIAFLGAFWDVRRRMKEWAQIRLYGGYPSLVAGLHYFSLALAGVLVGEGLALLMRLPLSSDEIFWLIVLTAGWGLLFSICVSAGPVAYTEFCSVVRIFRFEGEVD